MLPSLFQTSITSRAIMKLVAVALAILLYFQAADCRGVKPQAEPPSHYEQFRAGVVTFLTELKRIFATAISNLDEGEQKTRLTNVMNGIELYIKSTAASLAPVREGIGPQIFEYFFAVHQMASQKVEDLRMKLEPKWKELRQVVRKHLDEYGKLTGPVFKEYSENHERVVKDFQAKFTPLKKELEAKFKVNIQETKAKLTPIVAIIRDSLNQTLEELKLTYGPHFQEYKDQFVQGFSALRTKYDSGELQEKLTNVSMKVQPKLWEVYAIIDNAFKE